MEINVQIHKLLSDQGDYFLAKRKILMTGFMNSAGIVHENQEYFKTLFFDPFHG